MHIYHFLGRNILYNWSASVIVKNQKVNGMWQSYKNLRKKELFVVKTKYLCYILEYSVKCRKVPGGQVERPANKSQVEISDFLGRQKGNTKSSR